MYTLVNVLFKNKYFRTVKKKLKFLLTTP